jgi:hypothetical protein
MAVATSKGENMDQDVIYIDDDERNAVRRQPVASRPVWSPRPRPPRTVVVPPGASRPMVIQSGGSVPTYGYTQPQVLLAQQPTSFASRFGMTTGELIDTGIQILAAIQPLPAAPDAQGDGRVDLENLVTYQSALATHAKRDEQLRTLGNLLVRILK